MHIGVLTTFIESIGDDVFAIAVCEEVEGARGDDANKRWSKTFEERARRFVLVDITVNSLYMDDKALGEEYSLPEDIASLDKVIE